MEQTVQITGWKPQKVYMVLNRRTQAEFEYVKCHYQEHADVVGAKNILERRHRLLACGKHWIAKLCEAGTGKLSDQLEPVAVSASGILFL